ncbi:hypothetical protein SAMN05192529_10296 [Arachidicoccus rhizosphaerae]|uniref:Helix-turn-helix domain-containing protein n=1 Tax=Arachidicoccus rhizosphaerae TaxID=551991 RepID=A0A1H3W5C0_9BACT|nr:hypothetical protein [Arachidicoccus rhizosphaerae]SDZ81542.1 hypothetical protein SAMN05192529_10296 [Arachidicoccus rhizosphaerae]
MTSTAIAREIREMKALLEAKDMISEKEAADLLGMKLSSLRSRVSEKKFEGFYIVGAHKKKFFYKSKLLGLNL